MFATAECRDLIPATMAKRRPIFGQVSLHSFIWGQPIVSTTGGFVCGSNVKYIRWGLLYNLYADRLLGFNMFPQSVYDIREPRLVHLSYGFKPFNDRDKILCNQTLPLRNPVG